MAEQVSDDTEFVVDTSGRPKEPITSYTRPWREPRMVSTRLTEGTLELRYTPIDPYGASGMSNCEKAETYDCEVCHHQATSEGCPNCLAEEVVRLREKYVELACAVWVCMPEEIAIDEDHNATVAEAGKDAAIAVHVDDMSRKTDPLVWVKQLAEKLLQSSTVTVKDGQITVEAMR